MAFPKPAPPASLLGRHRILSPTAGVKVSPICLGAMNFGDTWKAVLGKCGKEQSFALMDYFYSQGGNFIDTAVNYQFGESEQWVGEWMEERGRRDEIILATKFSGSQTAQLGDSVIQSNFGGNSAKNIYTSFARSLRNLRTTYIDIFYVHYFDNTTSIPELMRALHTLISTRQVLYLGISDTPAWLVVKANCYARQHGLTPFSVYQGQWSAACRDFEREIVPMCLDEGLAMAPWGVLAGGGFKGAVKAGDGNEDVKEEGRKTTVGRTGKEDVVGSVLQSIAEKHDTLPTSVALAYIMAKAPYVFPILGGRKISHLESNISALGLRLREEEKKEIDNAYGFEMGFPHSFLNPANAMVLGPQDNALNERHGTFDWVKGVRAIEPWREGDDEGRVRPVAEE
ncbi:Aldo/keto reductase [Byssothecium circinans]|uniref:Aldo/keto reductase n=1 Tax=Byssothecium circinans TaxID=147558 RepID=A0A6A5UAV1_9PLEO|nr:Aldo/keto reductase [Byssothecium circinans]